jgi:hypothetical protein
MLGERVALRVVRSAGGSLVVVVVAVLVLLAGFVDAVEPSVGG